MKNNNYLVDVLMFTYNHEKFIAQAIEGVLMQNTNFKFRLLIGEDSSTDKTREVIQKYADNNKEIIFPFYQSSNIGAVANTMFIYPKCSSKYIAFCEGDDYWTDEYKLQKQVDFMESYPEHSMLFCNSLVYDENTNSFRKDKLVWDNHPASFDMKYFVIIKQGFSSATTIFKREIMDDTSFSKFVGKVFHGDAMLRYFALKKGTVAFVNEVMAVYRVHKGGILSTTNKYKQSKASLTFIDLIKNDVDKKLVSLLNLQYGRHCDVLAGMYRKDKQYLNFIFYIFKSYIRKPFRSLQEYKDSFYRIFRN